MKYRKDLNSNHPLSITSILHRIISINLAMRKLKEYNWNHLHVFWITRNFTFLCANNVSVDHHIRNLENRIRSFDFGPGIPMPVAKANSSRNQGGMTTTTLESLQKTERKEGHVPRNHGTLWQLCQQEGISKNKSDRNKLAISKDQKDDNKSPYIRYTILETLN